MPLSAGTKLGRYEIRSLIGAGGMGEVYQATDAQLKRDVAIKVLPEEFTNDADRLRRFQQEALATAALNHPHIVAVHDAGAHEGTAYVVTELLEGRTLKDVMAAGAVPLRKAVDYATQIASGLAAAHEKGIVHRDLKPANLFVTNDERVKILDFGLARTLAASPSDHSATATVPGTVLGTVGYMAPEQVRGEAADHRADIFAFGVILYEMLSGRRAFQRESVPGTLAAILHDDPPTWTGDGTSLSLRLLRLTHRCLEKSAAARFQSARDLMLVLSDEVSDPSLAAAAPAAPRKRTALIPAIAGALAFTLLGVWIESRRGPAGSVPSGLQTPTRFGLSLPDGEALRLWPPVPSGDGRRIALVLTGGGVNRIWVQSLDTGQWRVLNGTDGGSAPFFSPDGVQIGFVKEIDDAPTKLMRVGLDGSGPFEICRAQDIRGASWGDDDRIVFGAVAGGLRRVAVSGGPVETITTLDEATETNHKYPQVLPGATRVIFSVTPLKQPSQTYVAASVIGSQHHRMLIPDGRNAQYVPDHLVYVKQSGEVHAVRFDPNALEVRPDTSVALGDRPNAGASSADVALRVAGSGTAIYVPFRPALRRVMLASREGVQKSTPIPPGSYSTLAAARKGQLLLTSMWSGLDAVDVFVYDLETGTPVRITKDDNSRYPVWGPDEASVIYSIRGGAEEKIWIRDVGPDGSLRGDARPLIGGAANVGAFSVFRRTLLFWQAPANQQADLWKLSLDDPAKAEPLVRRPNIQFAPSVSPNGKWLAYVSNERRDDKGAQQFDIYVTSYEAPGDRRVIAPGRSPRWSRSGDELFFVQTDRLMSQRFTAAGPAATPPAPTGISGIADNGGGIANYAELPDGWFAILVAEPELANARNPVVVLNWTSQLKSKK